MSQSFNSDTAALEQRIGSNRSSLYDLEEWIFHQIRIRPNMDVLDLGCGTGKQMFALQRLLSPESRFLGVDISPDAVASTNLRARQEAVPNVTAIQCDLDRVIDCLQGKRFDLILSAYAIYYSRNMTELVPSLHPLLNPDAQVFICGYGRGTNREISEFAAGLPGIPTKVPEILDFISQDQIELISRHFVSCSVSRLSNKVVFTSSGTLLNWWKNHNSYIPEIHDAVLRGLDRFFEQNKIFVLSKKVLGICLDA